MSIDDLKHRSLFLLLSGWVNLEALKNHLGAEDDDWHIVVKWLQSEKYLTLHTIH